MADIPRTPAREKLIRDIQLQLGHGMIDLELDPAHYDYAIDVAFDRYRQRSSNATEESFVFLDLQCDVSVYTLPDEVQDVRAIYRRTMGASSVGSGASIDPFSLGFANNIYMIQNPGGLGGSGAGTLATYDFAMQFQSLAGRMFGRDIMYTWDNSTKRLVLMRKFTGTEQIAIHAYIERPEIVILRDTYARPWVRAYATAQCKAMLGEARGKFGSIAGPQGGVTLNGEALKTEAAADMERLDNELKAFVDSQMGFPFVIG